MPLCAKNARSSFSRAAARSQASCRRLTSGVGEGRAPAAGPGPAGAGARCRPPPRPRCSASAGTGTRDAERVADRARLAQQHVEHDLVDLVVGAVEQDGLHLGARLAEAVDAALALLQAVRVPGQVVVDDGVEVLLEVDALGQAVGGDQDAPVVADQLLDPLAPLLVADLAGDRAHLEPVERPARSLGSYVGEVVGGGDEAAEHDRPEAVLQQRPRSRRAPPACGPRRALRAPARAA